MKLKLVVLAGAKEGLEIPLKKDQFLIGRAKECALRAGSEAISRRHCAITRREDRYTVRDLKSRNGTYVNDQKIGAEVTLKVGDELRVGPLKFRVAEVPVKETAVGKPPAPTQGKASKQPTAENVADAAKRTRSRSEDSASEDDISRWLLGTVDTDETEVLKETRSLKAEETKTGITKVSLTSSTTVEDISAVGAAPPTDEESAANPDEDANEDVEEAENVGDSGGWNWFKRGKGNAKKKPGKLPPRQEQQSKDSREAAADILREMTRRR
jgi:pSer/pThr/pTyr-binding forkhead associated (FHA) protein